MSRRVRDEVVAAHGRRQQLVLPRYNSERLVEPGEAEEKASAGAAFQEVDSVERRVDAAALMSLGSVPVHVAA